MVEQHARTRYRIRGDRVKKPNRKDYPKGTVGTKQYNEDMIAFEQWVKNEEAKKKLNISPIKLPGIDPEAGINDVQAKSWFKYGAATAKKGTEAYKYYQRFISILQKSGIPKTKWQSVWNDAVDWVGTPGSGATGDPSMYLNVFNPGDYTGGTGSTKKYGTSKQRTETTIQYSASNAADYIGKTFEQEIGRTATKEEIDAYIRGVNAAAKKEPGIYEGTTTNAPGKGGLLETTTTKATSTTPFDPAVYAQNFARSRPDFAESFATKNFLKLIEGLLKDPNAIGTVVNDGR